jgi:hypothetical protein
VRAGMTVTALGALGCVSVLAVASGTAHAAVSGSDNPSGTVSAGATGGGSVPGVLGAATAPGRPGTGDGGSVCTYQSLVLNDEGGIAPGGPTPGGWYSVTCTDPTTGVSLTQTEWITSQPPTATAPPVDPYSVALQAERSIELPEPVAHSSPAATAVVNLPTWLWVDAASWHPYSVSASVGSVSATAVATPVAVTWSMGDGDTVTCDGPGTPFDSARPASAQSTDCSHAYQMSSGQPSSDGGPEDGSFVVSPTVTWAVSWSATGAAGGGTLPSLLTTASIRLVVDQVESVDSYQATAGPSGNDRISPP